MNRLQVLRVEHASYAPVSQFSAALGDKRRFELLQGCVIHYSELIAWTWIAELRMRIKGKARTHPELSRTDVNDLASSPLSMMLAKHLFDMEVNRCGQLLAI